jgi:acetyl-CoA carboxylase carboxyltransferase component
MAVTAERSVRSIVADLLDTGTLRTIRTQVRSTRMTTAPAGDGVSCGEGRIDGRTVFWFEQDPSVLGGSLGEAHADSICRVLDIAARYRAPVIGVHRSGGARIQEGVAALAGYGRIFSRHVRLRRIVPQIALVLGPCAGGASYGPALMDFVIMPRVGAYMFLTGPDVVAEVTGEAVTFEELGGASVAERSGLASLVGRDEDDVVALTRRLFSYLPQRIGESVAPAHKWKVPVGDPGEAVPRDGRVAYDVRSVIERIFDRDSLVELRPMFARNLVTVFVRLEGRVVGVIANQPFALAGSIDIEASRKGAEFVGLCDRLRIPLAVFVDTPGFLPGTQQELGGVIPAGADFLASFVEATVPKATVVLRKAFGGAYIVMNALDLGADYAFAWPGAEIAVLGARGAVKILERRKLAEAENVEALQAELEERYRERFLTPWPAAESGYIDEVIPPNETRERLVRALLP